MESIGEKLKTARESKGYSLEQVARDTHIAKRFLSALESEEFSMFPGEPYLMGFLRNYAEYLGLSAHEIVSLYKNLKLQEQPAPIDELLERPRSKMPLIVASIVVVVILAAGTFLLLQSRGGSTGTKSAGQASAAAKEAVNSAKQSSQSGQPATGTVYTFQGGMKEQAFRRGDAITVQSGGKDYRLLLSGIGSTVTLSTPTGVVDIAPNQERSVDLNGNGKPDVKLLVRSISEQDSIPSAVIRIDSAVQGAVASAGNNFSNSATAAQPAGNQAATAPAAEGPAQPAPATRASGTTGGRACSSCNRKRHNYGCTAAAIYRELHIHLARSVPVLRGQRTAAGTIL